MNRTRARVLYAVAAMFAVFGINTFTSAGSSSPPASVVVVEPFRVLDTRNSIGVVGTDPIGPGQTVELKIAGVGPVPADASGVIVNLTGTQATEETYVTAWPGDAPMPTASVLNLTPGINAPNSVTTQLGFGGNLSLFNFTGTTHLIADVTGYLIDAGSGAGTPGPPGPAGPQGPAGPEGAAGAVTAWGRVNGFVAVPTITHASSNVSSVTRPAFGQPAGNYCVAFDPPIPADRLGSAVATTFHGGSYPNLVITNLYCPADQLGVLLLDAVKPPAFGTNGSFTFIVP